MHPGRVLQYSLIFKKLYGHLQFVECFTSSLHQVCIWTLQDFFLLKQRPIQNGLLTLGYRKFMGFGSETPAWIRFSIFVLENIQSIEDFVVGVILVAGSCILLLIWVPRVSSPVIMYSFCQDLKCQRLWHPSWLEDALLMVIILDVCVGDLYAPKIW